MSNANMERSSIRRRSKSFSIVGVVPSEQKEEIKNDSLQSETLLEILEDFESNKKEVEDYLKSKTIESQLEPNPAVGLLEEKVFPYLREGMNRMLKKVRQDDSYCHPKSTFNGLDFLSEYLYNVNPAYPDRKCNWTYIFDMNWVVEFLKEHPRPYYPLHLIWSDAFAATKIQAFMRGYWERRKAEVQEVRDFWENVDGTRGLSPRRQTYNENDTRSSDFNINIHENIYW